MKLPRINTRINRGALIGIIATASIATAFMSATPALASPLGGSSHTFNWYSGVPSGDGLSQTTSNPADAPPAASSGCVVDSGYCTTVEVWSYTPNGFSIPGTTTPTFIKTHYELQGGYLTPQIEANSTVDRTFNGTQYQQSGINTSSYGIFSGNDVVVTNNMPNGGGVVVKLSNGNEVTLTSPGQQYNYNANNTQVSWIEAVG